MSVVTAPKNLNNVSSGLVLGSQPIVDSAVAYYTCQILDAGLSGVVIYLLLTFKRRAIIQDVDYISKTN